MEHPTNIISQPNMFVTDFVQGVPIEISPMQYDAYNPELESLLQLASQYCGCEAFAFAPYPLTAQQMCGDANAVSCYGKNKRVVVDDVCLYTQAQKILQKLDQSGCDDSSVIIVAKKKHERRKRSNRRSNFIGVSKNGPSWQAMITVNRKKTYIGTYRSEKDAAIAFDFYSMLIHNMGGKTNLSYTKGQLYHMIDNFMQNDQVLEVSQLRL